jgi:hypothetical protein
MCGQHQCGKIIHKGGTMTTLCNFADNLIENGQQANNYFSEKIIAFIDISLKSLIPWYLDYERENIKRMKAALKVDDFDYLAYVADMLKGHGGSYGFDTISNLGEQLFQAARYEEKHEAHCLLNTLTAYLDIVEIVYIEDSKSPKQPARQ